MAAVDEPASSNPGEYFFYDLPEERIAQYPVGLGSLRSESKLLHVKGTAPASPGGGTPSFLSLNDHRFAELPSLLRPTDLLVLNNSRVIPARFFPEREPGQTQGMEVLLLTELDFPERSAERARWEATARPLRKLKVGRTLRLSPDLEAKVIERATERTVILELTTPPGKHVAEAIIEQGRMPIPPYIRGGRAEECDRELYQTIYARALGSAEGEGSGEPTAGSVAAPTAGLHFTPELFSELERIGVECCFVTLHVGQASFLPVTVSDIRDHPMPRERFSLSAETIAHIRRARAEQRRIIAVGTTTVRALESAALQYPGLFEPWGSARPIATESALCISPGFRFQVVNAMITNFHQPRTTHLLLVAALMGEEAILRSYRHALAGDYRFLSYGDAMFLEPADSKEF